MGHFVYIRSKKKKSSDPGHWDEKKRIQVVTTFLATGNVPLTSTATGVPIPTIAKWKATEWWKEIVDRVRDDEAMELDARTKKIVDKALAQLEDRLDNGDYVYNPKLNKAVRVQAKMKDVHRVAADMVSMQQNLRKKAVVKEDNIQTQDRLLKLAETFAEFAKDARAKKEEKVIEGEVIDGESNALHD